MQKARRSAGLSTQHFAGKLLFLPEQSVLESADGVLGLAFGLELRVPEHLAGALLQVALHLLRRSFDAIFVGHVSSPIGERPRSGRKRVWRRPVPGDNAAAQRLPERICSVIRIATSSADLPSSPPTFGSRARATLSTKWASSIASGSPFSIGIGWTGIALASPGLASPILSFSP